ncbi:MAG: ComF family protein [bacterium]
MTSHDTLVPLRSRRALRTLQRTAVSLGRLVSDSLFPRKCLTCEAFLPDRPNTYLCSACAGQVVRYHGPLCDTCGQPFWTFGESFVAEGALCGLCRTHPPPFLAARAVGLYRGHLKNLVLLMKYRSSAQAAFALAGLLAEAYPSLFGEFVPDAVVPIPLHTERFLERELDQAVLMAREVARNAGWPLRLWLRRIRPTPPQSRLSRAGRRANVRNAFGLAPWVRPEGRTVLLIDDVLTTGATAREAARVLTRAGASAVYVYTAARAE